MQHTQSSRHLIIPTALALMCFSCKRPAEIPAGRPTVPASTSQALEASISMPAIELLPQAHWNPNSRIEDVQKYVVPSQSSLLRWIKAHPQSIYFIEGLASNSSVVTKAHLVNYPNTLKLLQNAFPDPTSVNPDALSPEQIQSVARIGAPYVALYLGMVNELHPTLTIEQKINLNNRILEIQEMSRSVLQLKSEDNSADFKREELIDAILLKQDELLRLSEEYSLKLTFDSLAERLKKKDLPSASIYLIFGTQHLEALKAFDIKVPNGFEIPVLIKE